MRKVSMYDKGILVVLVALKKWSFDPLCSSGTKWISITHYTKEKNKLRESLINYALSIYILNKSKHLINWRIN